MALILFEAVFLSLKQQTFLSCEHTKKKGFQGNQKEIFFGIIGPFFEGQVRRRRRDKTKERYKKKQGYIGGSQTPYATGGKKEEYNQFKNLLGLNSQLQGRTILLFLNYVYEIQSWVILQCYKQLIKLNQLTDIIVLQILINFQKKTG
ncbi:unnamed protein product [Paramecium octaurelia]|uniref:Uncharacterized protein n=1 Tax=Paramecium octaurelia TaxID=43137 RepID=A0A8S1X7A3_PAROT|nr:unnamed protein product [Paramecium octaurelia]